MNSMKIPCSQLFSLSSQVMGTVEGNKFGEPSECEWSLTASQMLIQMHVCMLAHRVALEKLLRLLHWDICELRGLGTCKSKLQGNSPGTNYPWEFPGQKSPRSPCDGNKRFSAAVHHAESIGNGL